jgi:hypothetical protein
MWPSRHEQVEQRTCETASTCSQVRHAAACLVSWSWCGLWAAWRDVQYQTYKTIIRIANCQRLANCTTPGCSSHSLLLCCCLVGCLDFLQGCGPLDVSLDEALAAVAANHIPISLNCTSSSKSQSLLLLLNWLQGCGPLDVSLDEALAAVAAKEAWLRARGRDPYEVRRCRPDWLLGRGVECCHWLGVWACERPLQDVRCCPDLPCSLFNLCCWLLLLAFLQWLLASPEHTVALCMACCTWHASRSLLLAGVLLLLSCLQQSSTIDA